MQGEQIPSFWSNLHPNLPLEAILAMYRAVGFHVGMDVARCWWIYETVLIQIVATIHLHIEQWTHQTRTTCFIVNVAPPLSSAHTTRQTPFFVRKCQLHIPCLPKLLAEQTKSINSIYVPALCWKWPCKSLNLDCVIPLEHQDYWVRVEYLKDSCLRWKCLTMTYNPYHCWVNHASRTSQLKNSRCDVRVQSNLFDKLFMNISHEKSWILLKMQHWHPWIH